MGVGAADELDFGHNAGAGGRVGFQEKPRDGVRIGRVGFHKHLAFDGATVFRIPTGASAMRACGVAGRVGKVRFGGLKYPLRPGGRLLTDVDLGSFAGDGEDGVLRRRRFGLVLRCCGEGETETQCGERG